jgi:DNA-binding transcriptional LysR family regulator
VVHDWVRAGKGVALKADWDLQAELREGSIVPCLSDYWCDEIDVFALCASRRHLSPRIRAFLKFIAVRLPQAVSANDRVPKKLRAI